MFSGKEASLLMQSLNKLRKPEEKLEAVLKQYTELVSPSSPWTRHAENSAKNTYE